MDTATEIEEVKVNAVIAEREIKSALAQNSLAIENLQTQLNNFADLVVGFKRGEPNLNVIVKGFSDEYKPTSGGSYANEGAGSVSAELEFYKNKAEVFEQKYHKLKTTLELKQNTKTNAN